MSILYDSHGVPISASEIPKYYANGWLNEGDAREYETQLKKIKEREQRDVDMLLNKNREPNLAAKQMEAMNNLSKYMKPEVPLSNILMSNNPASDATNTIRSTAPVTPRFLMSDKEKQESILKSFFPDRFK